MAADETATSRHEDPEVLCGSLSKHPVALGAAMHNAGYRALGLHHWHYSPFRVDDDLEGALRGMRALSIRGFGVSMPFKLRIQEHLDAIDKAAQRIGAVNTVVNDEGRLTGYNTDAVGAANALAEAVPLEGLRCLVLGAGGAARAVAVGLSDRGSHVDVANRSLDRAEPLAELVGGRALSLAALDRSRLEGYSAIIQTTSVGMRGEPHADESPLAPSTLHACHLVMDIVYKPLRTPLLRSAEDAGATTIDGSRMLLHQAAHQLTLYTGRPAPLTAMDEALRRAIETT